MRFSKTRALLCIVLCCSSVLAAEGRHGIIKSQDLAQIMQELKAVRGTTTLICDAVSMHLAPIPTPKSQTIFLLARMRDGGAVIAMGSERDRRLSRGEIALLRDVKFGDIVRLQGKSMKREGNTVMWLDGIKRISSGSGRTGGLGTIEDVLAGPFPMPAIVELSKGARIRGQVLSHDRQTMKMRASLAEIPVEIEDVKTATRTGLGTSCRLAGGRIDYLSRLPLGGFSKRVFASAAANAETVHSREHHGKCIKGKLIDGVRVGTEFGIIVRTEKEGDLLVYLGEDEDGDLSTRQLTATLDMSRGEDIEIAVSKSIRRGLTAVSSRHAMRFCGDRSVRRRPLRSRSGKPDPQALKMIEKLKEVLGEGDSSGVVVIVKTLKGPGQQMALHTISRWIDYGSHATLRALLAIVHETPAEKLPPEMGASVIRALFTCDSNSERKACAHILGHLGCREGIEALREAVSLHPSNDFAREAERAIRRISRTPPRE